MGTTPLTKHRQRVRVSYVLNPDKVVVIGLGYVGTPLALQASESINSVTHKPFIVVGFDINTEKVTSLKNGVMPFKDARAARMLSRTRATFTQSEDTLRDAKYIVIAVPTPVDMHNAPDYGPVRAVSKLVGQYLQIGQSIFFESTVNPGITREQVLPILERESGLQCGKDFHLVHAPERINPGDPKRHVGNINRVIGGYSKKCTDTAYDFYRSILTCEKIIKMSSLEAAEIVKVHENTVRDELIAIENNLVLLCDKVNGLEYDEIKEGLDSKGFGSSTGVTAGFVGGHCIAVDPYWYAEWARRSGIDLPMATASRRINESMPGHCVNLISGALNECNMSLRGATIGILGISYKPEIDDCRNSGALVVVHKLKELGANVKTFDPFAKKNSSVSSSRELLDGSDVVAITTGHKEFLELQPEDYITAGVKAVVEVPNYLDKEEFKKAGLLYYGFGRR